MCPLDAAPFIKQFNRLPIGGIIMRKGNNRMGADAATLLCKYDVLQKESSHQVMVHMWSNSTCTICDLHLERNVGRCNSALFLCSFSLSKAGNSGSMNLAE